MDASKHVGTYITKVDIANDFIVLFIRRGDNIALYKYFVPF